MLKAGMHPFRLYYTMKEDQKAMLDFEWSGPDFEKQAISPTILFHD